MAGVAFSDIPKVKLGDFAGRLDIVGVFGGHLAGLLGVAGHAEVFGQPREVVIVKVSRPIRDEWLFGLWLARFLFTGFLLVVGLVAGMVGHRVLALGVTIERGVIVVAHDLLLVSFGGPVVEAHTELFEELGLAGALQLFICALGVAG